MWCSCGIWPDDGDGYDRRGVGALATQALAPGRGSKTVGIEHLVALQPGSRALDMRRVGPHAAPYR